MALGSLSKALNPQTSSSITQQKFKKKVKKNKKEEEID